MSKEILEKNSFPLTPKSYSWIVRKQLDYLGRDEYLIEIKELAGCVSYGDTFAEAKAGLRESIKVWLKHHQYTPPLVSNTTTQLVYVEPPMTRQEFKQINYQLLHLLFN